MEPHPSGPDQQHRGNCNEECPSDEAKRLGERRELFTCDQCIDTLFPRRSADASPHETDEHGSQENSEDSPSGLHFLSAVRSKGSKMKRLVALTILFHFMAMCITATPTTQPADDRWSSSNPAG